MVKLILKTGFLIIFSSASISVAGQKIKALSVEDKIPDNIWRIIPKEKTTKLIILDFWATNCTPCLAAFPKMKELQEQFEHEVQIILVNSYENDTTINQRLKKINDGRSKNGYQPIKMPALPTINGDTLLYKLFPHNVIPHHVWINDEGKVLAITNGYNATAKHIQEALKKEHMNLMTKTDLVDYDMRKNGWMKPGHPALPVPVFYSAVMNYFPGMGDGGFIFRDSVTGSVRVIRRNTRILTLYQVAFSTKQKFFDKVLLETKRKELFSEPKDNNMMDAWKAKALFSYEINVPMKDELKINEYMQQDLNRYLGSLYGIEACVEKRILNSLVLITTQDGLLKTSGEKQSSIYHDSDLKWLNCPFSFVTDKLSAVFQDMTLPLAFVDETGFKGKVDMELNGDLNDLENIRTQLKQYGLDIIKEKRELEVLVIRDKPAPMQYSSR
jgi:thiol-disulfide isomerase/thioredoxin